MVTNLFGNISVLLLEVYVFESFSLDIFGSGESTFIRLFTYKHRVKRFGDPTERRRIV